MECARQLLIRATVLFRAIAQQANAARTPALCRFAFVVVLAFALAPTPRPTALGEEPPPRAENPPASARVEDPPAEPTSEQIQAWIKQLGDDDFQTRERAQKELVKAGNPAYFALEALPPSDDPEIRVRIERALIALELDAIEKLRGLGAQFSRRRGFVGKKGATEFNYFTISSPQLRNDDLAPLVRLKQLEVIHVEQSPITDGAIPYIRRCRKLWELSLFETDIGDGAMASITAFPDLEILILSRTKITNEGMLELARLTKLSRLSIFDTRIDGKGLAHLRNMKDQLVSMDLHGTTISDKDLRNIEGFNALKGLSIRGTNVTGKGLRHLIGLRSLNSLDLQRLELENDALAHVANCPALKSVYLDHTPVTSKGLLLLRGSRSLTHIQVSAESFGAEEAKAVEDELNVARGRNEIKVNRSRSY